MSSTLGMGALSKWTHLIFIYTYKHHYIVHAHHNKRYESILIFSLFSNELWKWDVRVLYMLWRGILGYLHTLFIDWRRYFTHDYHHHGIIFRSRKCGVSVFIVKHTRQSKHTTKWLRLHDNVRCDGEQWRRCKLKKGTPFIESHRIFALDCCHAVIYYHNVTFV